MLFMAAIQIRKSARPHLYLDEWYKFRGVNDEKLANRLGMHRETVHRWRKQQHRLTPEKIAQLAAALDCRPEDLWRPPNSPSLDAMLRDVAAEEREMVIDVARRILKKA
jgi:DNA-binding Xre family transcriptional regulator